MKKHLFYSFIIRLTLDALTAIRGLPASLYALRVCLSRSSTVILIRRRVAELAV